MEEYQKLTSPAPATAPEFGIPVRSSATAPYDAPVKAKTAQGPHQWSTGLCDCFSDPKNCCITCWCPCITFGQVAEIADEGSSSCGVNGALYTYIAYVTGCSCMYSCCYRSKMREQYSLQGSKCNDCLVHFFCEYCALCQEYRELERRGFDVSLGWHGNVERQNKGIIMAPIVEQEMYK